MTQYHVAFERLPWVPWSEGVRHKIVDQHGTRVRLVEYLKSMPPHWCERRHVGILLEGHMEIDFDAHTHSYHPGDAIYIPGGEMHRHRARIMTHKTVVFYVEEVPGR